MCRPQICVAACLASFLAAPLGAERLPVHRYTIADGLAGDIVNHILQDSRGFLWICTNTGLSRFDGASFRNYGTDDGLPHPVVNDVVETRGGSLWVATSGGLARLNPWRPPGQPVFTVFSLGGETQADFVERLFEDRRGRLWIATGAHLNVLEGSADLPTFRKVPLKPHLSDRYPMGITDFAEDAEGSLWIASSHGLLRRLEDGRLFNYPVKAEGLGGVSGLLLDRDQRIWMHEWHRVKATDLPTSGVILFQPEPAALTSSRPRPLLAGNPGPCRTSIPLRSGEVCAVALPSTFSPSTGAPVLQGADGRVWTMSPAGLVAIDNGRAIIWGDRAGLPSSSLRAISEDRAGNLWLGTEGFGVIKVARLGFHTYTPADGLGKGSVVSFSDSPGGPLHVTTAIAGKRFMSRWDGVRFITVPIPLPPSVRVLGWGWNQLVVQNRDGDWWVPTAEGLFRFRSTESLNELARAKPIARFGTADGLGSDDLFRLYEDRQGDLWIGAFSPTSPLTRWERKRRRFRAYTAADGFPIDIPTVFAEDRAGNLWIGLYHNGLVRYRDGRFEHFTHADGIPRHFINDLHIDRAGRLWVAASRDGLARVDEPHAARLRVVRYTTADGLASNGITCLTEDDRGRIYAGSGRGVDRLDPATGRIEHFTTTDGLANNNVRVAHRDQRGHLWFGTTDGLSRLEPDDQSVLSPPPVLISGLRVAGEQRAVSELGASTLGRLGLASTQRQVEIDFVGISFAPGERLLYQHRLAGASDQWSAPSPERTVRFVSLTPGEYRFEVRAVTSAGTTSPTPAIVAFAIARPIWQRWWFSAGAILLIAGIGTALHRARVSRLLEIERVRTRIATDLHDDLGARLSRISILAGAASRQIGADERAAQQLLSDVGETARGLLEATADIAWSIDPTQDDFGSLRARIRRFAAEVLDGRGIAWSFAPAAGDADWKLSADARRHLLLIFKEAIHNIVRHSHAGNVALVLDRDNDAHLRVEIRDDGVGFESSNGRRDRDGLGLRNMKTRARELGATFTVDSAPGRGTVVRLTIPI